jgi:hypothetical protein
MSANSTASRTWPRTFRGDLFDPVDRLSLTNACILTTQKPPLKYGFDPFYKAGNGYREKLDFQMNLFVNGHKILATDETHAVHLHRSEVRIGGNQVSRLARIFWSDSS